MKAIAATILGATLVLGLMPAAQAADVSKKHSVQTQHIVAASYAYSPRSNLPAFIVGGAVIGGIAAAVFCPPCTIGTAALTTGSAIAIGAGIGAVSGLAIGAVLDSGIASQS